jgi:hypothetical protein
VQSEDLFYFWDEEDDGLLEPNEERRITLKSSDDFRNWCIAEKPAAESVPYALEDHWWHRL